MAKVLIVDDDEGVCEVVEVGLSPENIVVEKSYDGADALERLRAYTYDVLIFDWDLPGISGLELCKHFRATGGQTPIIMLTAKSMLESKETGFDAGADDYLTKPFAVRELRARIKALLRRPAAVVGEQLAFGDLTIEPRTLVARKGDQQISLSPKEFAVLEFFLRRPRVLFSSEQILNAVWTAEEAAGTETIRTHIKTLRAKLGGKEASPNIINVFGAGYKLDVV